MPCGFKVELNGTDITAKVARFEITASLESYVRELSAEIADPALYDTFDFSVLPESPSLEVFTRVADEWVSQGRFFAEKPTYQVGIHRTDTGIWGRSESARLGAPFAPKVSKLWDRLTTFYDICREMCEPAGLSWDPAFCEIPDFLIYAFSYQADNVYPVEVISELIHLAHGENAVLTTDRAGHVRIRKIDRAPEAADHDVTDAVLAQMAEEPEWPDFGNRVKISGAGSLSGYGVRLTVSNECLQAGGKARAYARVTDQDGLPVENIPVQWAAKYGLATFQQEYTNTQTVLIPGEEQRASTFYEVQTAFPPKSVTGVWAKKDTGRTNNLAADGFEIDGNTIRLARRLQFCDQLLVVSYQVEGVAVNVLTGGSEPGTEKVSAVVGGSSDSRDIYIDNPCACPPSITLKANPYSIQIGEAARLLAYVEIGGAPVTDGRLVYMTIDTVPSHGSLAWTSSSVGTVNVTNEKVSAVNEISGLCQVTLEMFPAGVSGIYRFTQDDEGNILKYGGNLYASHSGKTVTLNSAWVTGTEFVAEYTAVGAVVNVFKGLAPGTDRIRALIRTSREAPTEAFAQVSVGDENSPDGCCNDGLCESEPMPCDQLPVNCQEGQVWCKKSGVYGCRPVQDCDDCGIGKIWGYKAGVEGCWDNSEVDNQRPDGGSGKVYGRKGATEGCFQPSELDTCGPGFVYCYRSGVLGCHRPEDCDKTFGGGSVQCPPGTTCCKNKITGKTGCWPSSQCSSTGLPKSDKPNKPNSNNWDTEPKPDCVKADQTVVKCGKGEICCEKGGVRGCWPWQDCDHPPDTCKASDCSQHPTSQCLSNRFAAYNFDPGGFHNCSCEKMCESEFDKFGTTQGYDGASYKPVFDIVTQRMGIPFATPEFWETYEELKQEAIAHCIGSCKAAKLAVSGPDAVTKPGGWQYTASGGFGELSWSISGTGASIDQDGFVTLVESACGSYTVTVEDESGQTASMDVRITNAGKWVVILYRVCKSPEITCSMTHSDCSTLMSSVSLGSGYYYEGKYRAQRWNVRLRVDPCNQPCGSRDMSYCISSILANKANCMEGPGVPDVGPTGCNADGSRNYVVGVYTTMLHLYEWRC